MQKFVNQAIGVALMVTAAFAHANVVPATVQAFTTTVPRGELSTQSPHADRRGSLMRTFFAPSGARADAALATPPAGERTSTAGMLLGALAIMAIVARRRWNTRG